MSFTRSVYVVWLRYFAVFQKNLWYGVVTTFVEPILYLASFGFGLGSVIGDIQVDGQAVSYRAFVLAGVVGQTVLFAAFFEAAYGGFVRMYYQKIYQAIAVTPVTLSEVLWGELSWCSSRSLLSAFMVLTIGVSIGDFTISGALATIPFVILTSFVFGALGMLVAAKSKTIESISYPQYLLIFPMFLFCGVYFPLANLPEWTQYLAMLLPLTALLSVTRWLTLGFEFDLWSIPLILVWLIVLVPWARKAMRERLVA